MNIPDPTKIFDRGLDTVDKLTENQQSKRHIVDTTSPYMLPHLIRPILAIWGSLTYTGAQIYCLVKGMITGEEALAANAGIMVTVIGFYFNSRRNEKINAKKTEAAIKIEETKAKVEILKAKEQIREDRRAKRLERRNAKKTKLELK